MRRSILKKYSQARLYMKEMEFLFYFFKKEFLPKIFKLDEFPYKIFTVRITFIIITLIHIDIFFFSFKIYTSRYSFLPFLFFFLINPKYFKNQNDYIPSNQSSVLPV